MSVLPEFQARQIVQRMHRLRYQIDLFAAHARTLRALSTSIDARMLLQEADSLLSNIKACREEFAKADGQVASLSHRLSPFPPAAGGLPPAAQWGSEFRAGSRQFIAAVQNAEREIVQLRGAGINQMNSPTRTATAPGNVVEVMAAFADVLAHWIETRRNQGS